MGLSRRERKRRRIEEEESESSGSDTGSQDESPMDVEEDREAAGGDGNEGAAEDEANAPLNAADVTIDNLDVESAEDAAETQQRLLDIERPFADMDKLEMSVASGTTQGKVSAAKVQIQQTRQDYLNEYFKGMVQQYSDDLDELRGKLDFKGERSLRLLADALKQSGNIFDDETLKSIVE